LKIIQTFFLRFVFLRRTNVFIFPHFPLFFPLFITACGNFSLFILYRPKGGKAQSKGGRSRAQQPEQAKPGEGKRSRGGERKNARKTAGGGRWWRGQSTPGTHRRPGAKTEQKVFFWEIRNPSTIKNV
jgi:hypothetical protein